MGYKLQFPRPPKWVKWDYASPETQLKANGALSTLKIKNLYQLMDVDDNVQLELDDSLTLTANQKTALQNAIKTLYTAAPTPVEV